jgi:hypothetical protein
VLAGITYERATLYLPQRNLLRRAFLICLPMRT